MKKEERVNRVDRVDRIERGERMERVELYRPGWVEQIQKESLSYHTGTLLLDDLNVNEDKTDKDKKYWIKKRGLENLREEFLKAEYFKSIDPIKANAEVANITLQDTVKLSKVLNLLEMT
eukprot:CAMPEP_0205812890 /NCGR_PEP_ID=MMETSP0205-20121125/17505_1 /ASSEMBLY_ACC=CAM_ASM_000278 /TAXON_ID=36767 /ORGANISM="Euplotes focardii, Strain TN1" /LENGTH=119 /DNA_ID=CAMNT_0053094343 /DNA_START=328 /DNA_END=683 /DNA_ORIENTATION=+